MGYSYVVVIICLTLNISRNHLHFNHISVTHVLRMTVDYNFFPYIILYSMLFPMFSMFYAVSNFSDVKFPILCR